MQKEALERGDNAKRAKCTLHHNQITRIEAKVNDVKEVMIFCI